MSDLPTGLVTFMITDIEGSTRLVAALGDQYPGVLARHDAVIRSAIAEGGGREVSTEGDSFFAVFDTPVGALRAAAAAQGRLAAGPWSEGGAALRVRMGLHTGEGTLGGANYVGLDVNRTARIAAAGHGGQVLVSDATRAVVERSLPQGITLRDLGQHRLKDLLRPEHLFEVVIEGLEEDFPPPRTLDSRPNNLPAQLTRFIGRESDVAAVRHLLAQHRLVTVTGTGGTGKTRLALQVGADAMAEMADGVFFVDLSAVTDSELVAQDIAGALRVRAEPGRPVLDTLINQLRDSELLLVIDNVEQVLGVGPQVLEPLLKGAPRVRVLVTSRVPLHVYGEHEYPLGPLAEPDAVLLFAERAAAVRSGFAVTAENARTVADITARLDALPLAIELAASRIKVLSPDGLLQRLDQRLALLSSDTQNLPERQRTLRDTIEWSYDLLTDAERRLFWRLAVFAGGADLDAVEAVANPDGELKLATLDGVGSLVDKNLLRRQDTSIGNRDVPRFGMLETIREYGLERLSVSAEEWELRRRHAEHWIAVAERASQGRTRAEQFTQVRQLAPDLDNFRAALAWAIGSGEVEIGLRLGAALRLFWRLEGHVAEGLGWLDTLLVRPGAADRTALRARALTAAADVSGWTGDADTYLSRAQEAVAIYRDLGDPHGIPDALEELGAALIGVGQPEAARASLGEARDRNLALGNRQGAAECTLLLGIVSAVEGRAGEARARFEESMADFTELGDPYFMAMAERLVGQADRYEEKFDDAESRFRSSLIASRDHELPVVAAGTLYAMAELALARGSPDRALRLMGASEALRDQIGEAPSGEVAFLGDVRGAAAALMDAEAAERLFREGRSMPFAEAMAYALGDDRA
ncbi:MAG TPA: adenylate/guanylate cyclase domain-containing protein [Candidatus Limnocylindria bacterium]|nr:adenylate/guanylate cyclase domain-containing protein [Candidatus Limnocylindria bacterium]